MDADTLITRFTHLLPDSWATFMPFALLMLSGVCNVLALGLKPPEVGSRRYAIRKFYYIAVTWGAFNFGHAANRLQCERTGVMVARKDVAAAKAALTAAAIPFLERESGV